MIIDLHVHSVFSDGASHPQDICYMAKKRKVRVIVTDHDTVAGQKALLQICPEVTLPVYAMERTAGVCIEVEGKCYPAHVNVFCPHEFSAEEVPGRMQDMRDWASFNGCVLQWNHPFYWFYKVPPWHWRKMAREGSSLAEAVEAWNGNSTLVQNLLFANSWGVIALRKKDLIKGPRGWTANTDAHLPWHIGLSSSLLPVEEETFDSFAEALRKARPLFMRSNPAVDRIMLASRWLSPKLRIVVKLLRREAMLDWWDPFDPFWVYMRRENAPKPEKS